MELVELGNIAKAHKQKLSNKDKRKIAGGAVIGATYGVFGPLSLAMNHELLNRRDLISRTQHKIANLPISVARKIPPRGHKYMFTKLGAAGALAGGAYEYHKIKHKK